MAEKRKPNGFILVASKNKKYLTSAVFAAESLKEYWPEAKVSLFTQEDFYHKSLESVFDSINYDAPRNQRAKLWALDKTPYNITTYLDADVEIMHEDIKLIFDLIAPKTDILLTKIRPYNGKITKFPGGELTDHCGLFMYRSNKRTLEFMKQWWLLWQEQENKTWKWDTTLYPEALRPWDQWTYWWLQNKTTYKINHDYFPDDARWNFVNGYKSTETDKPIVIYHHTVKK